MSGSGDIRRNPDPIEYLVGELDEEERTAFESRLREDPVLREEVAEAESLVFSLRELPGEGWTPVDPPPLAMDVNGSAVPRDAGAADGGAGVPDVPATRTGLLDRFRIPVLAGAAAALLAGGIALGVLLAGDNDASPGATAAEVLSSSRLSPAGQLGRQSRGSAEVLRGADGEQGLSISVSGMPATAPGRYYELWLMRGGELVSLGGFKVGAGGRRDLEVPLPVDPADYRLIDISLERADGGPGHSAVSLLRGPA